MSVSGQGNAWYQREISIPVKKRGCHVITDVLQSKVPEIKQIKIGTAHIFIKHTSASLAVNEVWDSDVRVDTEMMLNRIVPESIPYQHSCEGPDDMPAHFKACMIGSSVTVPVSNGRLNLGTWQGVWLCEHRNHAGARNLVVTIQGAPV
ncbi:hypothetical protein ScPMuIL_016590 [Solemya velum]